ncbi:MAG: hypothetical protein ACI9EF_001125 [Pseudohongiellaceae bacterium]|jgi:hypothetical protein
MNINKNDTPVTHSPRASGSHSEEEGWVLIAALLVAVVSASLTVGWARHAVLAKGKLEMSTGASRTEEASRSGFERTRELMNSGQPPGTEADGNESVVTTSHGDEVRSERIVDGHDRRNVNVRAHHSSGNSHRDAALRGRAQIVPGSQGNGKRTRLSDSEGAKILLIPGLTMVTGTLVFTPSSDLSGVYLLENGSRLVMEDCDFTGTILTRASLNQTNVLATGGSRPVVELKGGCTLREGSDLPGMSICGPDLIVQADSDASIDVRGMVVAEEINLPCRGVLRKMVVSEGSETISSKISRPGHKRGPVAFPSFVEPGSERMTYISFPTDHFTAAEMDAIEDYDVDS